MIGLTPSMQTAMMDHVLKKLIFIKSGRKHYLLARNVDVFPVDRLQDMLY